MRQGKIAVSDHVAEKIGRDVRNYVRVGCAGYDCLRHECGWRVGAEKV